MFSSLWLSRFLNEKSENGLTFDPDVGFWKLKKGKSSEFRWESIFEGKKIQKIQKIKKKIQKIQKNKKNPKNPKNP